MKNAAVLGGLIGIVIAVTMFVNKSQDSVDTAKQNQERAQEIYDSIYADRKQKEYDSIMAAYVADTMEQHNRKKK